MSTPKSSYEPRHEAEVVAWQDLTEDQRDAVNGAHGYFSRMAEIADGAKKRETSGLAELDIFLPHIDEERRNHVVLIDGERGTGKTAVMLRVLVDWSAAVRGKLREDIESKDHGKSPVTLESAIVPVGLLDLQALSPKAMLGLHLVGHLQRVVEAMERRTPKTTKSAPWASGESEELKSRKAWRKFLSAAAAAWDGNLKERQGKIDPEAYVIELEQAERERLEIGATFRAFVDALVEDYNHQFHPKKMPFFVITIDDADLNPQRTMEIFELIRVLWHSRVGFLIAGDGDLFVTVLEEDFKRKLETPSLRESGALAGGPIRSLFEHANKAKTLAGDCYRKAIPPMQRFLTGLPAPSRFSKLEPLLSQIASSCSLPHFRGNLADYLVLDDRLNEALPRRIRELLDLREQVDADLRGQKSSPCRFAMWLWRAAFERAEIAREVREMPWVTYNERSGRLDVLQTSWTPERHSIHQIEQGSHIRGVVYDVGRMDALLPQTKLPETVIPALHLVVNIAAHERYREVNDLAAMRLPKALALVEFQFIVDGVVFASTEWDIPQFESFLDYGIFLNTWRRYATVWLSATGDDQDQTLQGVGLLACRFIELVLNHLDRKWMRDSDQIFVELDPLPPSWQDLAERLVKLTDSSWPSTFRDKIAKEWAKQNICFLAAPEFGLSAAAANAWLEALQSELGERWEMVRKDLQGRRKGKSSQLGDKIDELSPNYAWTTRVSESNALHHADNIRRRLMKIPVKHPNGNTWPPHLAEYLTDSRFESLLKIHNNFLSNVWNAVEMAPRDVAGAEEVTVFNMWEAAVPLEMRVRDYVQWDRERSGLKVSIPRESWTLNSNGTGLLGNGLHFSTVTFKWTPQAQNTISYTDPLLRLAWDVAADKMDAHPQGTPTIAKWPGAQSAYSVTRDWSWPIPNWTALIDWELMIESWAAVVKSAAGLRRDDDSQQTQRVTDALAFWFVCRVAQMSVFRDGHVGFQFELTSDDWYKLGMNLPHTGGASPKARDLVYAKPGESKDRYGARWDAYKAWWNAVVVMAAPGSGLSRDAAEAFLKGLYEKHDVENRPIRSKSHAIALRHEYAIRCTDSNTNADTLLQQIDRFNPDHPWHKFFASETK